MKYIFRIRARQPSLPLMTANSRMNNSTIDRRQYQRTGISNNELLESVLDSSATTPIASELPDLPYIDLSFARPAIEDKTNTGDEDDAYNSLHSGSIGSGNDFGDCRIFWIYGYL